MATLAQAGDTLWDVVVVGGGPAGMMAAGTAAEAGAKVILIEKNEELGKKLLITGGGRCNVTNSEFDNRKLLQKFKSNGKFLFSAFSQWSVKETLEFFHKNKMQTKVENELRTFPVSDSAQSVWDVLVNRLKRYHVEILSEAPVAGIVHKEGIISGVKLANKKIVRGRSVVIATGGTSRPETGSTGDGYGWLKSIGHTIIQPTASLVPVAIKDRWVKRLAGVKLSDVKISVFQNGKKQNAVKGKILFTHVGVTGPTVLNMSKDIGELLKYGDVALVLDVLPGINQEILDAKLQELFVKHNKKKLQNAIVHFIPAALALVVVELSEIQKDKPCNAITRGERLKLVGVLKGIPMQVEKLLGLNKAVITSGGVALEEVDFKTMRSRLFPNLYLVGDILNVDRPSGGYSLQLCWTTGFVAGKAAAGATAK